MIFVVYIPEPRLEPYLAPLVRAAARRGYATVRGPTTWPDTAPLFGLGLDGFLPAGFPGVAVDHWFDAWTHPPRAGYTLCYMSEYHRATHGRLWDTGAYYGPIVGCLWARPLPEQRRDLAVFFTPKMRVPGRGLAFWLDYRRAFFLAWRAARRQGLTFVVKTRRKHGDPAWLRLSGASIIRDDVSSLALLNRARWCLHFGSAAAFEAAHAGCYAYWWPAPEGHLAHLPGSALRPSMFAWPGVSRMGPPPTDDVPMVCSWEREAYLSQFLGNCDGKAADRVLDIAESLA